MDTPYHPAGYHIDNRNWRSFMEFGETNEEINEICFTLLSIVRFLYYFPGGISNTFHRKVDKI